MNALLVRMRLSAISAVILTSLGSTATADDAADALATYRSYLETREEATTVQALYPFLPTNVVTSLQGMKEIARGQIGEQMLVPLKNVPAADGGSFRLVQYSQDENEIALSLEAATTDGGVRTVMSTTVEMAREGSTWKVSDIVPRPWTVLSQMPSELHVNAKPRELGPAATVWTVEGPISSEEVRLVGEAEIAADHGINKIRWDPRGQFLLAADNSTAHFYHLDPFKSIWSADVGSGFFGLSFRHDGKVVMGAGSGYAPLAVPVDLNLEADAAEMFFTLPKFDNLISEVGEDPRFFATLYSPAGPEIALVIDGIEQRSVIIYPTDQGYEAEATANPVVWHALDPSPAMAWAPDGSSITWMPDAPDGSEPGAEALISSYPEGEVVLRLSHPNLTPGHFLFDNDGIHIATMGTLGDAPGIVVWRVSDGEVVTAMTNVTHAAFAPDGLGLFVVRSNGAEITDGVSNQISYWRFSSDDPQNPIAGFPKAAGDRWAAGISALSVSPNGRYLAATAYLDGNYGVRVWELGVGQ